ncbi:MAG: ABA4-like family protein [Gammaproteobacteria bacterium]
MDPGFLFKFYTLIVVPAWLLLAFAPRWIWTRRLVFSAWIPGMLAVAYIKALMFALPFPEGGSFNSLEGVMILFQTPYAVLVGWIHYLAFDLFIGAWEVRDAQRRGINHWLVVPCLFFTLMLGPIGLLMYFVLRGIVCKTVNTVELSPQDR